MRAGGEARQQGWAACAGAVRRLEHATRPAGENSFAACAAVALPCGARRKGRERTLASGVSCLVTCQPQGDLALVAGHVGESAGGSPRARTRGGARLHTVPTDGDPHEDAAQGHRQLGRDGVPHQGLLRRRGLGRARPLLLGSESRQCEVAEGGAEDEDILWRPICVRRGRPGWRVHGQCVPL